MNNLGWPFLILCILESVATDAYAQAADEAIAYLVLGIEDGQQAKGHEVKRSSEGEYDLISSSGGREKLFIKEIEKCKFKIKAEPKLFREKEFQGKKHRYYFYAIFDLTKYSLAATYGGAYSYIITGNNIKCRQAADENDSDITESLECEGRVALPELDARPVDEVRYRKAMEYLTSNFCKPRAF